MDVNLISISQVTVQIPNPKIALCKGVCIIRDMYEMREDQVFCTREAQCLVDDMKWMGVSNLSSAFYSALQENIQEKKLVINDGLQTQLRLPKQDNGVAELDGETKSLVAKAYRTNMEPLKLLHFPTNVSKG
jgi:hypothetical protein